MDERRARRLEDELAGAMNGPDLAELDVEPGRCMALLLAVRAAIRGWGTR